VIGGTVPLSGIAASYASVGRGAEAYFKSVNARGGVNKRKITYKYVDDQYNPAQTVQAARQLVQQDHVFAIFNSLGTEHNLSVRSFLNATKVPQLFAGSGATTFGPRLQALPVHDRVPAELRRRGQGLRAAHPEDEAEREDRRARPERRLRQGPARRLQGGLGAKRKNLVAEQSYDALSTDVSSQIARPSELEGNRAAADHHPRSRSRGLVAANRLGWRPQVYVNQVGSATNIMRIVSATANPRIIEGAITSDLRQGPADAALQERRGHEALQVDHAAVPAARRRERRLPRLLDGCRLHVRRGAEEGGQEPDARSVVRAVANLNLRSNPFLIPGVVVKTSPTDHFPLDQGQLQRWSKNQWNPLGQGHYGEVVSSSRAGACRPAPAGRAAL
jgi:hypothetical protein